MKKIIIVTAIMLFGSMSVLAAPSNTRGLLWMNTTEPVYVATDYLSESPKCGTATSVNWLRLITTGDAGIRQAVKNGKIQKIHYIDQEITKFIVIYEKRTTRVYGE